MSKKKIIIDDDFDEIPSNYNKQDKNIGPLYFKVNNNINKGEISYIIKKYQNTPIVSIYNSYNNKVIIVKRHINFFEENGSYLIELKNEKYKYMFIGGTDIFEFNLIEDDNIEEFKCTLKNIDINELRYSYLLGKKYIYFLSDEYCIVAVKRELFPYNYESYDLYDFLYDNLGEIEKTKFNRKIIMNYESYKFFYENEVDVISIEDIKKLAYKYFDNKIKPLNNFIESIDKIEKINRFNYLKKSVHNHLNSLYKENIASKKYKEIFG